MTSMARPKRDFVLSTRAPYAPIVMLIGAVVVIGVVIRLLNTSSTPSHPLSGAPVGTGDAPVVVTDPATKAASGSLSLMLPVGAASQTVDVGPTAFPAGSFVSLSVILPTDEPTSVDVALSRLQADGSLQAASPIRLDVEPDVNGVATVRTSVAALTEELGAGIYRVVLRWQGDRIGGVDVALAQAQPSNLAIFDSPRAVTFVAGEYTGIRLGSDGSIADQLPYRLGKDSGAPAAALGVINGTPHVLISAGVWAGYWVPVTDGITIE